MTTVHSRAGALVALLVFTSLGGCARSAVHAEGGAELSPRSEALRFVNEGRDRVDVYLVSDRQSWRIGRLEPGQASWLKVPDDIPVDDLERLQLVVLENAALSVDPRRDPRAVTTVKQPFRVLSGVRWAFWHGQITSVRLNGGRAQRGIGTGGCAAPRAVSCT